MMALQDHNLRKWENIIGEKLLLPQIVVKKLPFDTLNEDSDEELSDIAHDSLDSNLSTRLSSGPSNADFSVVGCEVEMLNNTKETVEHRSRPSSIVLRRLLPKMKLQPVNDNTEETVEHRSCPPVIVLRKWSPKVKFQGAKAKSRINSEDKGNTKPNLPRFQGTLYTPFYPSHGKKCLAQKGIRPKIELSRNWSAPRSTYGRNSVVKWELGDNGNARDNTSPARDEYLIPEPVPLSDVNPTIVDTYSLTSDSGFETYERSHIPFEKYTDEVDFNTDELQDMIAVKEEVSSDIELQDDIFPAVSPLREVSADSSEVFESYDSIEIADETENDFLLEPTESKNYLPSTGLRKNCSPLYYTPCVETKLNWAAPRYSYSKRKVQTSQKSGLRRSTRRKLLPKIEVNTVDFFQLQTAPKKPMDIRLDPINLLEKGRIWNHEFGSMKDITT